MVKGQFRSVTLHLVGEEVRGLERYLEVLFVAVYIGGPAVVITVEPALLRGPSPIRVGGGGTDLHVGDPARLHPQRHIALKVYSRNTHTQRLVYTLSTSPPSERQL